ncbi:MAG TPA: NAD(P) transhydrogenase subunit alpha [Beutenbergiaceae bacterium]|nr:NAD(P) transhydrogenase subunit alpha [Beutenbergiaceae bacterium]
MDAVMMLTLFVLAAFVGFEVVSKVATTLHTPLMSGANAIHGIILVGAIIVTAHSQHWLTTAVGALAVVLATINLVGGFWVTGRMLRMFAALQRADQDPRPGDPNPQHTALGSPPPSLGPPPPSVGPSHRASGARPPTTEPPAEE